MGTLHVSNSVSVVSIFQNPFHSPVTSSFVKHSSVLKLPLRLWNLFKCSRALNDNDISIVKIGSRCRDVPGLETLRTNNVPLHSLHYIYAPSVLFCLSIIRVPTFLENMQLVHWSSYLKALFQHCT